MLLKGKTAVITGCNRGIGKATMEVFAKNGADIFACVRKERTEFTEEIQRLMSENKVEIIPLYFDLTDEVAMKAAVAAIRKTHKAVDVLVNNAGIITENALFQMTPIDNMRKLFEVNFFAQMQFTQYISRLMQRNKRGSIINFSSIVALDGSPGQLEYVGSKAAIIGATKTLAREFGVDNIRVNAVAPGLIETDMGNKFDNDYANTLVKLSDLARRGKPEEIANVVLFLASDLSTFLTGQVIRVDGGGGNA
jgi:3-oxoacyl-[acyl-carrier protein] reductase